MEFKISREGTGCCACGSDCCTTDDSKVEPKKQMTIDFLYLDLSICTRCQGAENSLEEAIAEVAKVLEATGIEVKVNKVNIATEELANQYRFGSSPTIRLNGRDIQMDVRESLCESCGDLCGDDIDCRVWVYQGKEYTVPPKAMIIEAILKEAYGRERDTDESLSKEYVLPDNLKRFFAAMQKKQLKEHAESSKNNGCCSGSAPGSTCC